MFVSPRTPKELRAIWISFLTLRPPHPVYCVGPPQSSTAAAMLPNLRHNVA
jgi:hypothetical protein